MSQLYDAILAPSGLRTTQRAILNHIARAGAPSVGELAADLVVDRGALAHNLKPLERDGYVQQDVDLHDRRNRVISLTEEGRAKLRESERLCARTKEIRQIIWVGSVRNPARSACSYRVRSFHRELREGSLAALAS